MRLNLVVVATCVLAVVSCSTPSVCGLSDPECQRAVEEIEGTGLGVVAARITPCPEPGPIRCFAMTLADGSEMSAEAYPDRVDIGRYEPP